MTKDEIQELALKKLEENNFIGTVVLDMGTGKCKLGSDAIRLGKFQRILITTPRTNLVATWISELEKWIGLHSVTENWEGLKFIPLMEGGIVHISNIQTCYKWSKEQINFFDFIIFDEVHTCGEEYFSLVKNAKKLGIPILGLTGTPALDDDWKSKVLYQSVPIVFSYMYSAKDGLINKRRYIFYEYELNDNFKITSGNKVKNWQQGELSAYNYAQKVFETSAGEVKSIYFKEVVQRTKNILEGKTLLSFPLSDKNKSYLRNSISKDFDFFKELVSNLYTIKDVNSVLYSALQIIKGFDYSVLGMRVFELIKNSEVPTEAKTAMIKYSWAMSLRKKILLGLSSSQYIASRLSSSILAKNTSNKLLVFSERVEQAQLISANVIHGKQSKEINDVLMNKFNSGELRGLANCQMLTLGLNLKGVNYCIMESFTSSATQFKQKAGRSNRLPVDEIATVIFIIPKNTQAEVWFKEIESSLDLDDVEVYTISSIEEFNKLL